MTGQRNQEESLIQNLKDAGCKPNMIELFMSCHRQNRISEQLRILAKQRGLLLDHIHDEQRRLDCLDHLIYQLKAIRQGEES